MNHVRPDAIYDRLTCVDAAALWRMDKRALLLDLDNTITGWNHYDVADEIKEWIKKAKAMGFKIAIVSNNHERRIKPVADALGVEFVERAGKPMRRGYRKAMALFGLEPCQGVCIGDQLVTDILGGNRLGLYTIWVRPLNLESESMGTRIFNRVFERMIIRSLKL